MLKPHAVREYSSTSIPRLLISSTATPGLQLYRRCPARRLLATTWSLPQEPGQRVLVICSVLLFPSVPCVGRFSHSSNPHRPCNIFCSAKRSIWCPNLTVLFMLGQQSSRLVLI